MAKIKTTYTYQNDEISSIMRDVPSGWLLRYMHANGASLFFIVVYLHVFRGMYYSSYARPRELVWILGVIILLLMIMTAFIGYVLPWGQMSLWGATVITSLASAIPVFGNTIVSYLWGGFSVSISALTNCEVGDKILLNTGTILCIRSLKPLNSIQEPVRVDTLSPQSIALQRLHAGDLIFAYIVGLLEGDGSFIISKNNKKYIRYTVSIELHVRDKDLLYEIKKILAGIGSISFRKSKKTITYSINNQKHLKSIIIPMVDKYPLLTNKQYDFLRLKKVLLSDNIFFSKVPKYKRPLKPLYSETQILEKPYFIPWLIGFIEAEGSFCIITRARKQKVNISGCFSTQQKDGEAIMKAIKLLLQSRVNLSKKKHKFQLKIESVKDIKSIISLMDLSPIKLLGYKKLQYIKWLSQLKQIKKYYSKFKIPEYE
jgi:hypothetical protein